jgi:hypothetical protein
MTLVDFVMKHVYDKTIERARGETKMAEPRKIRRDLTAEEKARLEKYGAIDFKSAGATRKK